MSTTHSVEKRKRVAVVGAGWNGLQTAKDLLTKSAGRIDVTVFEKLDDVGGTWHPSNRTEGLKLHAPLWVARFDGMQYDESCTVAGKGAEEDNNTHHRRLEGREVQDYNQRFADFHGIRERTKFLRKVIALDYSSTSTQVTLTHANAETGSDAQSEVYDFVIFASHAAATRLPSGVKATAGKFKGKFCHSAHFQKDFISEIKSCDPKETKVAVVGASKSAVDCLIALDKHGLLNEAGDNVAWVYSSMFWFMNYERCIGDRKKTFSQKFDGFWFLACLLAARYLSATICLRLLFWRGLVGFPTSEAKHMKVDPHKCHFGILDQSQFKLCDKFTNRVRNASVKEMYEDGLVLEDGRKVECTHVVFATGFSTGWEELKLTIDGAPAPKDQGVESYFYLEHMPTVGCNVTAQFTFGAMRATPYSDLILSRLNNGVPTLAERQRIIDKQSLKLTLGTTLGFYRSTEGKRYVQKGPTDTFSQMLCFNFDWMAQGILTFPAFFVHWWGIFVLQVQTPIVTTFMYK